MVAEEDQMIDEMLGEEKEGADNARIIGVGKRVMRN